MSIITWKDEMSVGLQVIDDQHKKLMEVINDLDEAVAAGKGSEVHEPLFEEIVDYFMNNFNTEESLMLDHGYPELELHRGLHLSFVSKIKDLRARALEGERAISEETLSYLAEWLVEHDIAVDKKLGAFLVERGDT